ncbi:hypothetical protein ERN12_06875 [Rhodobacteraceae bacterium]|nr:hypothetical protein ERN12_06875 [Paracoccaceae bacterium]
MRSRKDMKARGAKTHEKTHNGDTEHVDVGRQLKPVRRYHVSDVALHDIQTADYLLMRGRTGSGV